jgi:hypothetical protein
MRKSIISGLAIISILALTGCVSPSASNSQVEPSSTQAPEVVEKIYSDTMLSKMKARLDLLYDARDEIEGTSSYRSSSKKYAQPGVTAFATIFQRDGSRPTVSLRFSYFASDWIFFEEVVVNVDGENTRFSPGYSAVSRSSSSGNVYEWWSARQNDTELLTSIGNSETTIVRLAGDTYKKDYELSSEDRREMLEVVMAYEWLLYEYNNKD